MPTVVWAARRPLRTVITSGETLNSSRCRDRLSSTPPGTHAPPEPRAGNTPAPGANSSRDKKCPGASRDSRLRAPRPAPPAARAASAPAPLGPGNSPSAQAAAKKEAGVGPGRARHNMAEHRSCSRGSQQPPPGHPAASRQRQLRWRPPQHHIPPPPSLLPPLLPAPLPWQRGAKALSPASPSVPPPAARPGSPPAC